MKHIDCFVIYLITLLFGGVRRARAEPSVELSAATGLGTFVAGITPGRFAVSPSALRRLRDDPDRRGGRRHLRRLPRAAPGSARLQRSP
ncbi:MAG: hypothetical protein ACMG6S_01665 [Byssovorax sp.]